MVQGSLAHRLRVLRAERGLTLREAASLTGVAKETISDIERGLRHPHDPTLAKIAKGYGVPVEYLLEEPVLPGKAKAPPEQAGPNALTAQLTAEIAEVQDAYQSRLRGLVVLTERWETRLRQFGDDINQETLENMAVEGSCLTEFFLEATLEEMGKIAAVVGHARPEGLASGAAFDLAAKVSIMRPAYERWKALGDEIQRIGVKLFGEDRAQMSLENFEPGWATRTGLNEMAKRRAQKIQVA
jgi:transcriptional regulator with XRE-family HTH domain